MPGTTESSTTGSPITFLQNSSEDESLPEPIEKRTWREKFKRNWLLLRQGHEAMMMDKIQRQNRMVEANARQQLIAAYGEDAVDPPDEDSDMGVNVGNETHYHLESAKQPERPRSVLPAVLLSALLAGGGATAGTIGLTALASSLLGGPRMVDTDTDNITEVTPGFGEPETVNGEQ